MKILNLVVNILAFIGEAITTILGYLIKMAVILFLVFSGPLGWIMLYLWGDLQERREERGIRTMSKP